VATAYDTSVAHTGGTAPYTWAATGLPEGLSLNPANGVITGIPTTSGLSSVVFTVTDSTGTTASATLTAQVNAAPSRTAVQVSGGIRFSCALTAAGAVQCWGFNGDGQLGNGGTDNSSTPAQVSGLNAGVQAIASSEDATCAITAAGTVECWGGGNIGELGQGQADLTDHRTPVAVSEVGNSVTAISASGTHFCAVTAGEVYCWGYNWYGEVNGIPEDQFAESKAIGPVHIPGLSSVTAVTAGDGHNCAITGGQVKCWGNNASAELGTGEASDTVSNPVVATVLGATQVSQVIAGAGYTCVVTTGHTARCWGYTDSHRLGTDVDTGELNYTATPVTVDGLTGTTSMLGVKGVNACAVTTAGAVTCWGSVAAGDFTIPNYLPTVAISSGISLVGPGKHHSCAVTKVGGVTCWGLNGNLQLGTDDTEATGPIAVPAFG
jgi:alpha-tubulin suppressor-like RCC1 family protein